MYSAGLRRRRESPARQPARDPLKAQNATPIRRSSRNRRPSRRRSEEEGNEKLPRSAYIAKIQSPFIRSESFPVPNDHLPPPWSQAAGQPSESEVITEIYRAIHSACNVTDMALIDLDAMIDVIKCARAAQAEARRDYLTRAFIVRGIHYHEIRKNYRFLGDRALEIINRDGYMLLSLCVWSPSFQIALALGDSTWDSIVDTVGQHAMSLELFAKLRGFPWHTLLTSAVGGENIVGVQPVSINGAPVGERLNVPQDDHHHWYVQGNTAVRVENKGKFQNTIRDYLPSEVAWTKIFSRGSYPVNFVSGQKCVACNSRGRCGCTLSKFIDSDAFMQLIYVGGARGRGIRTLRDLRKDEYVGAYLGRLCPPYHVEDGGAYVFMLWDNHGNPKAQIDSALDGNWTRYVNHSCKPNLRGAQNNLGSSSGIFLYALQDIPAFTELTLDYGHGYFGDHSSGAMYCHCNEPTCRYPPPR